MPVTSGVGVPPKSKLELSVCWRQWEGCLSVFAEGQSVTALGVGSRDRGNGEPVPPKDPGGGASPLSEREAAAAATGAVFSGHPETLEQASGLRGQATEHTSPGGDSRRQSHLGGMLAGG